MCKVAKGQHEDGNYVFIRIGSLLPCRHARKCQQKNTPQKHTALDSPIDDVVDAPPERIQPLRGHKLPLTWIDKRNVSARDLFTNMIRQLFSTEQYKRGAHF
jgi:hypothetical protein